MDVFFDEIEVQHERLVWQENAYYPFGLAIKPLEREGRPDHRFTYNGKELEETTGLLEFEARMHDPQTGRFHGIDPKAETYATWSPYVYAGNDPVRFMDIRGEGPGDRVKAAEKLEGTAYKQQTDSKMRTEKTTKALEYMDCSELVCRVLDADGITSGVKNMNTSSLIEFFSDSEKYESSSDSPETGDIVLWKGHTGVVKGYDSDKKKVTVIHATRYKKKDGTMVSSVTTEKYKLSYYKKKGAKFYRPKQEEVIIDGGTLDAVTISGTSEAVQPITPTLVNLENSSK